MKAIVQTEYGSPDVLRLKEVEKPVPQDDEVLVRVHAASINSWDWDMLRGEPPIVRLWGFARPRHTIPGADIAGRVEAVGKSVSRFKPGDEVFGDLCECGWGGFAEFACARENALGFKPTGMTFEQAAAIPQAGVMAVQGLRDTGKVRAGQRVLINGAGGAAGTFAIQLAKLYGAEVTGVDRAVKFDAIRSLGADHVIDYTREDFTKNGRQYDLIFDLSAYHSVFDYKRALCPGGKYLMIGGSMARMLQILLLGPLISKRAGVTLRMLGIKPNVGVDYLCELFAAGSVKPVIDRVFPLRETADAFRYYAEGAFVGKIVIAVGDG